MAFKVDKKGNITLVQGDSGQLVVNGLPTDQNYLCFFAIQDQNRKPVGQEIPVNTGGASTIPFLIPSALTDLLTVPLDEETWTYYYGVKLCSQSDLTEDTLILGGSDLGIKNTITVYPKKVEGI